MNGISMDVFRSIANSAAIDDGEKFSLGDKEGTKLVPDGSGHEIKADASVKDSRYMRTQLLMQAGRTVGQNPELFGRIQDMLFGGAGKGVAISDKPLSKREIAAVIKLTDEAVSGRPPELKTSPSAPVEAKAEAPSAPVGLKDIVRDGILGERAKGGLKGVKDAFLFILDQIWNNSRALNHLPEGSRKKYRATLSSMRSAVNNARPTASVDEVYLKVGNAIYGLGAARMSPEMQNEWNEALAAARDCLKTSK